MLLLIFLIAGSFRDFVLQRFSTPRMGSEDIFGWVITGAVCFGWSIETGTRRLRIPLLMIAGVEGVHLAAWLAHASSNTWIFISAGSLLFTLFAYVLLFICGIEWLRAHVTREEQDP
jgi:hypothetical protein